LALFEAIDESGCGHFSLLNNGMGSYLSLPDQAAVRARSFNEVGSLTHQFLLAGVATGCRLRVWVNS
jgi:hypothetical protein